jgi:hypothetical protein
VILDVAVVIQWRALQVVTATPYLSGLERLTAQFPGLHPNPIGLLVPIPTRSPEEVLAECLAQGIQVDGSRIIYCVPLPRPAAPEVVPTPPRPAALDRVPPASSADFPQPHPLRSAFGTQPSSAGRPTPGPSSHLQAPSSFSG